MTRYSRKSYNCQPTKTDRLFIRKAVKIIATIAEMSVKIGADTTDFNRKIKSVDKEFLALNREMKAMSRAFKVAEMKAMLPFRKELMQVERKFFDLASSMGSYEGSNKQFMKTVTALGAEQKRITDNMINANKMVAKSMMETAGEMLNMSTQASKISANYDRMNNPLLKVNKSGLAVANTMNKIANSGNAAVLSLKMLGPNASMKALYDMQNMINQGLMRFQFVALGALITGVAVYGGLHKAAMEARPDYAESFEQMGAKLREAFEPMVQVFADVMIKVYDFISAVADLAIAFNEAYPTAAKIIQAIMMLVPALTLLLSPLAIGIGLWNGMLAAWGMIWPIIAPLITGLAAMSATVWLVAAAIVGAVAVGIALYKNWDTIKAKAIEVWGFVKEFFIQTWDAIKEKTVSVWNGISEFFTGLWESIKTVFFTAIESIQTVSSEMWASLVESLITLWTGITEFFTGVWEGIKTIFATALTTIIAYVNDNFGFMIEGITSIFENVKNIFSSAWDIIKNIFLGAILIILDIVTGDFGAIPGHVSGIMDNIKNAIRTIWDNIKQIFTTYIDIAKQLVKIGFDNMKNAISNAMTATKDKVSSIWSSIKSNTSQMVENTKKAATDKFEAMKAAVGQKMDAAKTKISNTWNTIKTISTNLPEQIKNTVRNKFQALVNAVQEKMNAAKNKIQTIWNQAKSFLQNIDLTSIGRDIIQGLINGITSKASALFDKAKGIATSIKNTIKGALDINSPSREMRWIGQMAGIGLELGLSDEAKNITKMADKLGQAVMPKIQPNHQDSLASAEPAFVINPASIYLDSREIGKATFTTIKEMDNQGRRTVQRKRGKG